MSEQTTVELDAAVLARLIGADRHLYGGCCPDGVDGWSRRDLDCPHCRDLIAADAALAGRLAADVTAELRRAEASRLRQYRKARSA